MPFQTELKKIGLKDKEVAVYLACLELGPSPVQQISRKAKVVRATTYVVLNSLMNHGLVTQFKEGKKTLFSPEPPRKLLRILEKQEEVIEDKKNELEGLLPKLHVLMKSGSDTPTVRYFSGIEGIHAIRQEIVMYAKPGDTLYNFTPIDYLDALIKEKEHQYHIQRSARGIKAKTLFTTKSEASKKALLFGIYVKLTERRFISPEKFPSTSGMTIYRDRIAIGTFTGKIGGVIIESESMSEMMKRLFDLAWDGAGK